MPVVVRINSVRQPRTEWFVQVARRLMQRSPGLPPLEAVRLAMDVFPNAGLSDPAAVVDSINGDGDGDGVAASASGRLDGVQVGRS